MGFGVVALIESFILLILFLLHTHTHPHEPSLYSANNSVWFLGLSQNVLGTEKLCPFSATFFRSDRKVNGRRALSFILGYLLSGRRISRPTRGTAQPYPTDTPDADGDCVEVPLSADLDHSSNLISAPHGA